MLSIVVDRLKANLISSPMRRDASKRYPPVTQEPRFLDPTLAMVLPRKERTPTSGGKLVGVQICVPEDMPPDLASASAKMESTAESTS
jgi:hypothetical protein